VGRKLTLEVWKERSNQAHDGFYDYSESKYYGMLEKITLVCPLHGEVEQLASSHSRGQKPYCCSPGRPLDLEA